MTHPQTKQIMIGLPKAGKTTFLAALWHVLESEELPETLRLERLHGDQSYLSEIRRKWLVCQQLERTFINTEQVVSMVLHDPRRGLTTEMVIPDPSGESFRLQWQEQTCTRQYHELAKAATGALLFVNAQHVKRSNQIPREIPDECDANPTAKGAPTAAATTEEQVGVDWTADHAPTQVQLVELLQFLMAQRPPGARRLQLAVSISAWDKVQEVSLQETEPAAWLARCLPLLHQFLRANPESFAWRVYGISAQGGDLNEAQALLDKPQPSERIIVVGPDCGPHDITAPIRWIMS